MDGSRTPLLALGGVLVVAALAFTGWLTLRAPADEFEAEDRSPDRAAAITAPLEVRDRDRTEEHTMRPPPWPFEYLNDDIADIRKPGRRVSFHKRLEIEYANNDIIRDHTFALQLPGEPTTGEMVDALNRAFEPTGLKIYTLEPFVSESVRYKGVDFEETTLIEIVQLMNRQSHGELVPAYTPLGVCLGTKNACVQARLDAKDWELGVQREAARFREDDSFLAEETYRPNFREATIGAVISDITKKTGIETVVGERLWAKPVMLTWQADSMPLDKALDHLAKKLKCFYRVKNGRVFLLLP